MSLVQLSQVQLAKTVISLLATVLLFLSLFLHKAGAQAADSFPADGYTLSLGSGQPDYNPLNSFPALPAITSITSFDSTLNSINHDLIIDGVADNLDLLQGSLGTFGQNLNLGYQAWKVLSDSQASFTAISAHPSDPGSDWAYASPGLGFYGSFGTGEFLPGVAGGFATLGGIVETTADAIRSRFMENLSENLVYTSGAPLDVQQIVEQMATYGGEFSVHALHLTADGGWSLDHFSASPFDHNSISYSWANTHITDLGLNNGSLISGNFFQDEQRDEHGGAFANFYEPTSVTIVQHSQYNYNISFNGANWNQNGSIPIPADTVPDQNQSLISVNDMKYFPSSQYLFYGGSPKPTPVTISGGSGLGTFGGAAFTAPNVSSFQPVSLPIPQVGGVLMPATIHTNQPKDLKRFFND